MYVKKIFLKSCHENDCATKQHCQFSSKFSKISFYWPGHIKHDFQQNFSKEIGLIKNIDTIDMCKSKDAHSSYLETYHWNDSLAKYSHLWHIIWEFSKIIFLTCMYHWYVNLLTFIYVYLSKTHYSDTEPINLTKCRNHKLIKWMLKLMDNGSHFSRIEIHTCS